VSLIAAGVVASTAVESTSMNSPTGQGQAGPRKPTIHRGKNAPTKPTIHRGKSPTTKALLQTESLVHTPAGTIATGPIGPIQLGCSQCGAACGALPMNYCARNGTCVQTADLNRVNCALPGKTNNCETCFIHATQNVEICPNGYWEDYYDTTGCYCPRCWACTTDADCTSGQTCTGAPKKAGGPKSCVAKSCGLFDPCGDNYYCTAEAQGTCRECPWPICPDTCNGRWQQNPYVNGCPVCPTCIRRFIPVAAVGAVNTNVVG